MFPHFSEHYSYFGAFLTICFQPSGVLLFLAQSVFWCSRVITSRRPWQHLSISTTQFLFFLLLLLLWSDGKPGGAETSLLQAETPLTRVLMSGQEPRMGPDLGPNVPPSAGRIGMAVGGETVLMTIKNCSNFVQSEEVVISRWLGTSDLVCPGPLHHGPQWSWTPP